MFFTLTANPVLDLIFHQHGTCLGERHFFDRISISGGGFGLNAARALKCRGGPETRSYLLCGEGPGRFLESRLREEGLDFRADEIRGATRIATLELSGEASRMLVSPSPKIGPARLEGLFEAVLSASRADDPVLAGGSVARGVERRYVQLLAELCERRSYCCCDVRTSHLRQLAAAGPFILRLPSASSSKRCLEALHQATGAKVALCSLGTTVVFARVFADVYRVEAPGQRPVNPFGPGDCLMAVLAAELQQGTPPVEALAAAAGAAAASVLTPVPGDFDPEVAGRLAREVRVESIIENPGDGDHEQD